MCYFLFMGPLDVFDVGVLTSIPDQSFDQDYIIWDCSICDGVFGGMTSSFLSFFFSPQ